MTVLRAVSRFFLTHVGRVVEERARSLTSPAHIHPANITDNLDFFRRRPFKLNPCCFPGCLRA